MKPSIDRILAVLRPSQQVIFVFLPVIRYLWQSYKCTLFKELSVIYSKFRL